MNFFSIENLRSRISDVFSVDVRSLAVVRILTGVIILLDLASRARDIPVFYGDVGVLPSSLLHTFSSGEWAWSLHLLDGGSPFLISALFVLNALSALALTVGYYTRSASVVTWLLTVSLHNANILILQGGDVLLRGLLFVGMFLPWGAIFSVDSAKAGYPSVREKVFSGWTAAFLLQIAFLYYFASFFKDSPDWLNGTAIYYTLSIDQYATPVAHFLLRFPDFLEYLTYTIRYYQHVALFLLFSPFLLVYLRTATAMSLMLMHLSFALCMHLGMFSWISMTALVGFIPSEVWNGIEKLVRARAKKIANLITIYRSAAPDSMQIRRYSGLLSFVGVIYIAYLFVWQANNVVEIRGLPSIPGWEVPAHILRIDQRWNLFAPSPYKDDGWFVVPGTLQNGTQVDLYKNGAPLSYERPENLFAVYSNTRWRKYGIEMRNERNAAYRPYYADYLCRAWNKEHADGQRLMRVEFVYMEERTPPPGQMSGPVEKRELLIWECYR